MLRFLCRQATIILVFTIGNKAELLVDPDYYVPFLVDLQDYYKASGITILYDDNAEDELEKQTVLANFLNHFSSRYILSQALHYSKIEQKSDYYISVNVEALFTAFLTSKRSYEDFSKATIGPDMSYHTWLVVFVGDDMNRFCHEPIGNPFHLVFNSRVIVRCHDDNRIYKWYSLYKNRTEVLVLAKWKEERGVMVENQNYYDNRFDLSGKVIRIATPTNLTSETSGKMSGFFNDLLSELQSFMNFTLKKVYETDAFGKYDPTNDTWSGLVGYLATGEVDLVVAPVTITKYRMDYIDFSKPLLLSQNRLYVKQPLGSRVPWSAYFQTFSMSSWGCIAVMFVLSSLLTACIRATIEKSKFVRLSMNYVLENFIRIWGIYCQQGVPEFPAATPLRMAYLTKMLLTLVIWGIYSASITSYLTILTPSLPFSDINGFIKDGSYKVVVVQNSSDQNIILHGEDPVLLQLRPLMKNLEDLPTYPYAGFLQVCNEKVGFYSSDAVLRGISGQIPCTLTYIETGQYECLALGLTKRSPYISSINYNLRKLEDNGVSRKLHNWYFHKMDNSLPQGHTSIGFWSIVPLLSIVGFGFSISIVILFIEYIYRTRRHKRPGNQDKRTFY